MTQLVINLSRVTQQVGIIDGQGRRTSFRLMARGRVETNYEIDPNWIAHNPGAIRVLTIDAPVEPGKKASVSEPASVVTEVVSSVSSAAKVTSKPVDSVSSIESDAEGAK